MHNITFTTTSVNRPEIIEKTYESFNTNLCDINLKSCKLCINVDPLPTSDNRKKVIDVCKHYFGEVAYKFPNEGNFTRAYNWIWRRASTEYIFNLEDDWVLTKKISINDMLNHFSLNSKLLQVALRAYPYTYDKCPLSPSLIHERYYKTVAGKLNVSMNPEVQLRGNRFGVDLPCGVEKITYKDKLVVHPKNNQIVVKDIGRDWIKTTNFKKPKVKSTFTTWE
jgi:hypothetical protein